MARGKHKKSHSKKQALSPPSEQPGQYIGSYHEAPDYVKDNQHIFGGYRINYNTPKKILKSLFMLHNETLNIWTHLFGAIIILFVIGYAVLYINPEIAGNNGKNVHLKDKLQEYLQTLDNSTIFRQLTEGADHKLQQLKKTIHNIYDDLINVTKNKIEQTNSTWISLKDDLEGKIKNMFGGIIEMKQQFESKGVQNIMESVMNVGDSLNNSVVSHVKAQISDLTNKLIGLADSASGDFIDPTKSPNPLFVSRWPIFVFLWSAVVCLSCSAIFHLFYPMSGKTYKISSSMDYAGINVLISGSAFPPIYYGMYCNMYLAMFYLIIIAAIASTLFVACLFEWIHRQENRTYKAICFGGFGLFLAVPAMHVVVNEQFFSGGDNFTMLTSLPFLLCIGISYLSGLYVYTVKCPERHKPGQYDLCGHSHQIWHMMVICGIFFTYLMSLTVFEERKTNACPARSLI